MTNYTHNIVVAVPESLILAANHLAACVGLSEADLQTYQHANWVDAQNNKYAACNAQVTDRLISLIGGALSRPAWDVSEVVDMTLANQAFSLLSLNPTTAGPAYISLVIDTDGLTALYNLGLQQTQEEY